MNCRGVVKRKNIVENYHIEPVAHIKLLNGRIIHSDAGRDINDSYFIFRCTKITTGQIEFIHCGKPTAREICGLIGKDLPHIFNPLHEIGGRGHGGGRGYTKINVQWNQVRKQLYNATMLLITAWDAVPETPLFEIKTELETYVTYEPFLSRIKSINTMLYNKATTLRTVLDNLERTNNMRDFHFDLLINKLNEEGIDQYFE